MSSILSRISVKYQIGLIGLLGIIGLLAAVTIFFQAITEFTEQQVRMDRAVSHQFQSLRLDGALIDARRTEKDFLARKDDKYVERHGKIIEQASGIIDSLSASMAETNPSLSDELREISTGIATYTGQFADIVESQRHLGYDHTNGQQATLRAAVHAVETKLNEYRQIDLEASMLQMRRD